MSRTNARLLATTARYRKTPRGVLTNSYAHQRHRRNVEYSLAEFHERFLKSKRFLRLFDEWIKQGCIREMKPTIDRINAKKGYTLDNIQILTWAENRFKQNMERRHRGGAVLQMIGNKVVKRFKSQKEAARLTGLSQGSLSMALNGKRQTAGGYRWKREIIHENPNLLV